MNNDSSKQTYSSVRINDNEPTESPKDIVENAFQEQENRLMEEEEQRELEETLKKLSIEQVRAAEEDAIRKEQEEKEMIEKKGPRPKSPFTINNLVQKVDKDERMQSSIKAILRLRKRTKVMIVLITLAIIIGVSFLNYNKEYRNNPKQITRKTVISVGKEFAKVIRIPDTQTLVGDTFDVEGKISYNLQSDQAKENYLTDPEMQKRYYLINNLNKATTSFSIKQDKNKKKFFFNQKTSIQDKVSIEDKYLIENSTEYYYIKEYAEKFINNGNKTYFESLAKDRNANDNIRYMYRYILTTFFDNIEEKDYNMKNGETIINGSTTKGKVIEIELDNKKIIEVWNRSVDQLKKDKRANNIVQGVKDDIDSYKLKKTDNILEKNQKLTIRIYTKGFFRDMKKLDIEVTGEKDSKGIEYEKDYNRIRYSENKNPKYTIEYEITKEKVIAIIMDKKDTDIGRLEIDYNEKNPRYQFDFEEDSNKISIDYNKKITKKKKESYQSKIVLDMDIRKDKKSVIKGTITVNSKTNNKPKMEESMDDIIFKKDISEEEQTKIVNIQKNRLQRVLY
ncbi:MAG: hypothetical protein IJ193_07795 [Bacilli bacterium]|nr:hypothetical protein [Bacilli bacterium]